MYKQKYLFVLLAFLVCSLSESRAQISGFPQSGCAPLSVSFSGPAGATAILWNLGTAGGTSTLSNPNPLFTTPGTYNITYTAIVSGSPVSYTTQINVTAGATANFSYLIPPSHCAPMTVSFSASSSTAGVFQWFYGDLSPIITSTALSQIHTYSFSTSFVPIVTFSATNGCTVVATSPAGTGTIHVSSLPTPSIQSSNGFSSCFPPLTTNITGTNSKSGSPIGGGGLTYNWTLNGGIPSSSGNGNPGTVVFGQGVHTISLQVTDNNQCTNTGTTIVVVNNPSISISINPTVCILSPIPATVTTNQSGFWITASSPQTTLWPQLYNNQPAGHYTCLPAVSLPIDTVCFFGSINSHTITAHAVVGAGCPATSMQIVVFVEQVVPNFSGTQPSFHCDGTPFPISFNNLTTNNTGSSMTFSWSCDFPPSTSNFAVPNATFVNGMGSPTFNISQGSANQYTRYQYFMPNITMIGISSFGCRGDTVISIYDTIARPTAYFNTDKHMGCAPLTVTFRDSSLTELWNYITTYTWCNGAQPPVFVSGTLTAPSYTMPLTAPLTYIPKQTFTYPAPGIYRPYLMISTREGCTDISFLDSILVVDPPINLDAIFPTDVCAGTPVVISMTATPANPNLPYPYDKIDHWHAETDEGYFSGCITNRTPTFLFTHLGVHPVTISAYQAGCKATKTLAQTINVKGPVGKFQHETTCDPALRTTVNFTTMLFEASTATLNFGDGQQQTITGNLTDTTVLSVTHAYASTGNFVATLKSDNSITGCSYTFTRSIRLRDPKARITFAGQPIPALPNALACVKSPYAFFAGTSSDAEASCGGGYIWSFKAPTYSLSTLSSAHPMFASHGVPPGPPFPPPAVVVVDPVSRDTFRTAGIYTIGLTVRDELGCENTVTHVFRISKAEPDFSFAANPACYSDGPIQIVNNTQALQVSPDLITDYTWKFGDGAVINTSGDPYDAPNHTYYPVLPPHATFTVLCIAKNNVGCLDSATQVIQVNNPFANFYADYFTHCLPQFQSVTENFHVGNTGYATYSVNFADANPPVWTNYSGNFNNVSHTYTTPGVFISTLVVVDVDNCKNSETQTITVIGQPTADILFQEDKSVFCGIVAQPTLIGNPGQYVSLVDGYAWGWGVTSLPASTNNIAYPGINTQGVTTISLTVTVGGFCPSSDSVKVYLFNPIAEASAEHTTICYGDPLKAFVTNFNKDLYSWKWFFGDNVPQPYIYATYPNGTVNPKIDYIYNTLPNTGNNGLVKIQLLYYAPGNYCETYDEFEINIIKLEPDFKNQQDRYLHCLNISDTFTNTTLNPTGQNVGYTWSFGDGSTLQNSGAPATYNYPKPGVFTVSLTALDLDYGCKGQSVKQMTIFPLPKATLSINPTLICRDDTFHLTGTGVPGVDGIVTGNLSSGAGSNTFVMAPANSFTSTLSVSSTTSYSLMVVDNNGCESPAAVDTIEVLLPSPVINWDTTVIIGQPTPLNAYIGSGYTYTWSPLITDLNCDTCFFYNPISSTTVNTTYTVLVQDSMGCYIVPNTYRIKVDPKVSLDVPTAFTPNGDGINDIIYPAGWGHKKLIYFKIFNRWGQLLFESNDIKIGWDGTFQGVKQNMETYVYQVSVETLLETEPILTKTGTFKLLR